MLPVLEDVPFHQVPVFISTATCDSSGFLPAQSVRWPPVKLPLLASPLSPLSVFTLPANLSSPDNKKDKPKSAKAKSVSNSSLSESTEGTDAHAPPELPASAYNRRGTLLRSCARFILLLTLLPHAADLSSAFAFVVTVTPPC